MGFTPEQTVFKLVFEEGTPLHGLTVRARSCTVGEWNIMLADAGSSSSSRETAELNDKYAQMFLDHVVSWDLEIPAGVPVPLTLEGWNKIDNNHGNLIIAAWQIAMVGVPKTSKKESPGGGTSEEQSLGLAKLSESLPSWTPPSSS